MADVWMDVQMSGWMSRCLSVVKLFSNHYSYCFCSLLMKVVTHDDLCANTNKKLHNYVCSGSLHNYVCSLHNYVCVACIIMCV